MRGISKKLAFFMTVMFIAIALVASNSINNHSPDVFAQTSGTCYMIDSTGSRADLSDLCGHNNATPTSAPSLNLEESQRFLATIATKLPNLPQPGTLEYILLRQYGAIFVTPDPLITLPPVVYFPSEQQTKAFQNSLNLGRVNGTNCYLQKSAVDALNRARSQARIGFKSGNPGADCLRTFSTHSRFWRKYTNSGTLARVRRGEETAILSVVAPPGSSQHLWGLAVDLRVANYRQREILNSNGWFQTVVNDVPHWTYLGASKSSLLQLGFKEKVVGGISYLLTPL